VDLPWVPVEPWPSFCLAAPAVAVRSSSTTMHRRSGRRRGDRRHAGRTDTQATSATSSSLSHDADEHLVSPAEARVDNSSDVHRPPDFGVVIYDLETIHDAERGTYHEKGLHECAASEQITWKRRSQIIEFAAVDLHSGTRINVRSRPEFQWADVRSPAARCFAEDHGHDKIIQDESLPQFKDRWASEVLPFLKHAAGGHGRLAMIAHNGDAFDHIVLEKELVRLGLAGDLALELHRFDPIRTLKRHYGQDYGSCGQLALKALHAQHVQQRTGGDLTPHQAMDDCFMLIEVLSRWQDLGSLLADEIAGEFYSAKPVEVSAAAALLRVRFACPAHTAVRGTPPPPPPLRGGSSAGAQAGGTPLMLPPPPPVLPPEPLGSHELRSAAAEFVPGVQWTAATSATPIWGLDASGFASTTTFDCRPALSGQGCGAEGWPCNEKTDAPYWEPLVPPEAELAMVASMQYQ